MPIGYVDLDGRGLAYKGRKGGPVFLDQAIRRRIQKTTKLTGEIRKIEKKHKMFEGEATWTRIMGLDGEKLQRLREERDRQNPLTLLEKRAVSVSTRGPKYRFGPPERRGRRILYPPNR